MSLEIFKASVQYGDLKGTSSADRADMNGAGNWLESRGLKKPGEFILGIELEIGENHGVHKDPVCVHFLLVTVDGYDSVKAMLDATQEPVDVRRVSVDMPVTEFLALFKRFNVCLSPYGMLDHREYRY